MGSVAGSDHRGDPPGLRLIGGEFRPHASPAAAPRWYDDSSQPTSAAGKRYLVVTTDGPLTPQQRSDLEARGAELLGYLPVHGYRIRLEPGAEEAIRSLPFVTWAGNVPGHLRIPPELADRAGRADGTTRIRILLRSAEPPERVLQLLPHKDHRATASGKDGAWRVEAEVPAGALGPLLSRLTGLPEVEAIEPVRPLQFLNQDAVWVHQSFVGPAPEETPIFDQGIFGCGQVVAVADSGQDYDSCYFQDTVLGLPPFSSCVLAPCPASATDPTLRKNILYYNWSGTPTGDDDTCPTSFLLGTGHGTHTSGSAAGDSAPYADCAAFTSPGRDVGDGQAPGAQLIMQELGDGLEYLLNVGGSVWNLADVAYQSGARIHSISWGGACHDIFGLCVPGCTLPYDSFARDTDLAMWTYPELLMVQSAGNSRGVCDPPNDVTTPALAKSPVSVGSVDHGVDANVPSLFSSNGPVFDGRLKPTLAAQGLGVISAASDAVPSTNNCSTCTLEGTSMSAPTVAGLAALVREYFSQGFYAAGTRNPAQGFEPSGALLKAMLIDGAVALGAAAPGPDFATGYGRVVLGESLAFAGGPFQLQVEDHRDGLSTGEVFTRAFDVVAGTSLRATLVWSDFPAEIDAVVARVNELKLEVIDPNGTVWFQALDPVTFAPAQTSSLAALHDTVNVEERLVFNSPLPGRWVVRVLGEAVPWGPQPFALVVRGGIAPCPAPAAPGAPVLTTPADNQVQVAWGAVPGAAAYNVYRSLGACPGGPWIPVAQGEVGTSFLDTGVSGGTVYSYRVVATSDAAAFCESPPSPCNQVTPTGECTLAPQFAGVVSATADALADCSITLAWDAAAVQCGTGVTYSVYRSLSSGFAPGPGNRIARCIPGTSFVDAVDLVHGTDYHYIVRAEDGTSGHGGACNDGNEDGNTVEAAVQPVGPLSAGTFSDDAGDTGAAQFSQAVSWSVEPAGGDSGPAVYRATAVPASCDDLTSPVLTLSSAGPTPQLSFTTRHNMEYESILGIGSAGQVEIATGPGFLNWTRVELSPGYPVVMQFFLNNCLTTQATQSYFGGVDNTYKTYTASLAGWAGSDVRIRFHLSGDLLAPGDRNWWVDDIQVTEVESGGSCNTLAAGPPPIPDGMTVPGAPMQAVPNGGDLDLTWGTSGCAASFVNVYTGSMADFTQFTGGFCNIPSTGAATLPIPADSWFLVVGSDGVSMDGSWSRDPQGNELNYSGASAVCPVVSHVTNNACP